MAVDQFTDGEDVASRVVRAGQALLLLLAAFVVASAVVPLVVDAAVALGLVARETTGSEVVRTLAQFAVFVLVVVGYLVAADDLDMLAAHLPDRREAALGVVGAVVLLAAQWGLLWLLAQVGLQPGQNRVITPDHPAAYFLVMVVVSIVAVGPGEELLFRGGVQGVLRKAWGPVGAIGIASALFGLIHYPAVTGTTTERVAYVVFAAILGFFLGVLYEKTDNLVVPAFAHGGYNAVLFLVQYLAAIGLLS